MRAIFSVTLLSAVLLSTAALAEVPGQINYQGTLTDALGAALDTTVSMTFTIYSDSTGTSSVWAETQMSVEVTDGIFNVLLGSVNSLSKAIFPGTPRWLGIYVGDDPELSPLEKLVSIPHAFHTARADTAEYAFRAPTATTYWSLIDSMLISDGNWGLMRGDAENVPYGNAINTHVNLGIACTTGTMGQHYTGCTVAGGWNNVASGHAAVVGGGQQNVAGHFNSTVAGGYNNVASGQRAAIGGGFQNTVAGNLSTVAGGAKNYIAGNYSAILGGWSDTIAVGADYSYLFGINSKLTQASTFAVDMPHVRFGDETDGYEIPTSDGSSGQVMVTNGSGQVSWSDAAADDDWTRGTPDSVLFTVNNLALARGACKNMLYGNYVYSHVNIGVTCTTGTAGQHYSGCTVAGGLNNVASGHGSVVGGGQLNIASDNNGTVAGGYGNIASGQRATVGGGATNTASGNLGTISGGGTNYAGGDYATVAGGYRDTSAADYSFTTNLASKVGSSFSNSAAFNGMAATATAQTRVGVLSKVSGTFTIDHPLDPTNKILNHYFVESPEMVLIYRGAAVLGSDGRAAVSLPDYFDALGKNPMVQLTGVGTSDVFVAEKVTNNRFVIGGTPGKEVYWTVTAARKDPSAEITEILMPVEQAKEGSLSGRSLDDDFLATTMSQLERMGQAGRFSFRTQRGRAKYEEFVRAIETQEPVNSDPRN
jgi:hypothetical protein